jgi:hypothetical protein
LQRPSSGGGVAKEADDNNASLIPAGVSMLTDNNQEDSFGNKDDGGTRERR